MVGGTAVLGGLVNGECFGYDYYLDGTLTCNYADGYGSCPTFVFDSSNAGASTASLVECEKSGDTLAVRMSKKLGVDEAGIPGTAWPLDASKFAMWAYGRNDPSSTAEQPVALLHSKETARIPGLKIALGEPQNSCTGSFGFVGTGGAPVAPEPATPEPVAPVPASPAAPVAPEAPVVPSCTMVVDGIRQSFQTCSPVNRVGTNFNVMWNLTGDPNDPNSTIMTVGMIATMPDQYVSVGFPSKARSMKNAAAMILANSNAGSSLKQYYMTGYGVQDVFVSSQGMDLMDVTEPTGLSSNGEMTGMFTMRLPYPFVSLPIPDSNALRRRLLDDDGDDDGDDDRGEGGRDYRSSPPAGVQTAVAGGYTGPLASFPMIFAAGDVNPDGSLRRHFDDGATNMNLAYAVNANGVAINGDVKADDNESIKVAHQVIMAVGWGVLIPLGIVGGRAKMQLAAPKWYNVHRYLQSIGYLMGLVGVGLGFGITKSWDVLYPVHRDLGITITVLATVQVSALLWKPAPGTSLRAYWSPIHIWLGRSTALLAIANIYYGMLGQGEYNVETWAWAVYTAVLGLIVLLGVYSEWREIVLRREARERQADTDTEKGSVKMSAPATEQGDGDSFKSNGTGSS